VQTSRRRPERAPPSLFDFVLMVACVCPAWQGRHRRENRSVGPDGGTLARRCDAAGSDSIYPGVVWGPKLRFPLSWVKVPAGSATARGVLAETPPPADRPYVGDRYPIEWCLREPVETQNILQAPGNSPVVLDALAMPGVATLVDEFDISECLPVVAKCHSFGPSPAKMSAPERVGARRKHAPCIHTSSKVCQRRGRCNCGCGNLHHFHDGVQHIFAETQVLLGRIAVARLSVINRVLKSKPAVSPEFEAVALLESLDRLARLERYESRVLARRARAIRLING
jgi:hypothetical protein